MTQSSTNVQTYYVYNDQNQLSYVLPPSFVDGIGTATTFDDTNILLKQYGYVYKYDERGNCIYKRLPGCTPIYMVYDNTERLVMSQDGNQRKRLQGASAQWTVTKYDLFGRAIFSGLMYRAETDSSQYYKSIRDIVSNLVVNESYSGFANATSLTENFYDNYSFIPTGSKLTYDPSQEQNGYTAQFTNATGLLTGKLTYFLDGSGSNTIAMYYDDKGHVVQTRATNHLKGYDYVFSQYDFTGKVSRTYKTHGVNGASDTYKELYTYSYDNGQRLKTTTYSLNGGTAVTLASNRYDELGRLQTKTIGNGVDATTYSYNIQGNITDINGSKFSESLYYNSNTANLPNFTACYNGNIAGMKWNIVNDNLGYQRAYSFEYDNLNRLTNSVYSGINSSGVVSGTLDKYSEKLDYQGDKMGNLKALTRYENGALVENLGLTYQGNLLLKVDNGLNHFVPYGSELFRDYDNHIVIPKEYAYDTNGNMLYDANGGVSDIEYNVLNLPDKIHFTAGHKNLYTYDAGGQKLRVVNYSSNRILDIPMGTITPLSSTPSDYTVLTTDYVGNMIYENGTLKEILLPDGYYQNGTFYYYLKDHLGDNRVTINNSGVVVEKSNYYPSGTRFFTESTSNSLNPLPYRYSGKELEAMNGLNQMDYGARRRFSWGPIWTRVDPLAEKKPWMSPYVYCSGNPVNRIDPDGMDDVYSRDGKFIEHNDNEIDKRKDHIVIRDQNFVKQALIAGGLGDSKDVKAMPDFIDTQSENTVLSAKAYSNIFTDVLSDMKNVEMGDLANGAVSVAVSPDDKHVTDIYNNPTLDSDQYASEGKSDGKTYITASINYAGKKDDRFMFSTVSNIQNSLGVHEKIGHGQMGIGEESKFNVKTYQLQFNSPTWRNTTDAFKNVILRVYNNYINQTK